MFDVHSVPVDGADLAIGTNVCRPAAAQRNVAAWRCAVDVRIRVMCAAVVMRTCAARTIATGVAISTGIVVRSGCIVMRSGCIVMRSGCIVMRAGGIVTRARRVAMGASTTGIVRAGCDMCSCAGCVMCSCAACVACTGSVGMRARTSVGVGRSTGSACAACTTWTRGCVGVALGVCTRCAGMGSRRTCMCRRRGMTRRARMGTTTTTTVVLAPGKYWNC